MDLFLNYNESFINVRDRYLSIQKLNEDWGEKLKALLERVANNSSGKWSDKYVEKAKETLEDYNLFCERIDKMCAIFAEAEPKVIHMINLCQSFPMFLDGLEVFAKLTEKSSLPIGANDLMYNGDHHDSIVTSCDEVDTTSDLETTKLNEIFNTIATLNKAPADFLATEILTMEGGIEKQKRINSFEAAFEAFVTAVSDFNTTISSEFADVIGEYSNLPTFSRTFDYSVYIGEHYPKIASAAQNQDSELFDKDGLYGGDQGHPIHTKDPNLIAWIKTQPGFENMSDPEIEDYLKAMNSHGCGYVGSVNAIFAAYAGKEEEFEKKYGIPYYDPNHPNELNYDQFFFIFHSETSGYIYTGQDDSKSSYQTAIMKAYEDDEAGFKQKYGCDLFETDSNGNKVMTKKAQAAVAKEYDSLSQNNDKIETGFTSNTEGTINNRLQGYCDAHGDSVKIETLESIDQKELDRRTANGEIIEITAKNFDLDNMDGTNYDKDIGQHRMTVTEVLPDGRYVVSSWGKEYILDPKDADVIYLYSYEVEVN